MNPFLPPESASRSYWSVLAAVSLAQTLSFFHLSPDISVAANAPVPRAAASTPTAQFAQASAERSLYFIPISTLEEKKAMDIYPERITYNRKSRDGINRILGQMTKRFIAEDLPKISPLLKKNWGKLEREEWERVLFSKLKSPAYLGGVPGLRTMDYRTLSYTSNNPRYRENGQNIVDSSHINDLSADIGKTEGFTTRYDCTQQSVILALIARRIEESVFSRFKAQEDPYKKPANYLFATGSLNGVNSVGNRTEKTAVVGHAFIISPLTGAVIEPTLEPEQSYLPPLGLASNWQTAQKGGVLMNESGNIYSGWAVMAGSPQFDEIRQTAIRDVAEEMLSLTRISERLAKNMSANPAILAWARKADVLDFREGRRGVPAYKNLARIISNHPKYHQEINGESYTLPEIFAKLREMGQMLVTVREHINDPYIWQDLAESARTLKAISRLPVSSLPALQSISLDGGTFGMPSAAFIGDEMVDLAEAIEQSLPGNAGYSPSREVSERVTIVMRDNAFTP
ncbi:MAG: hypothetical protein H6863_05745 [Rhodospirillales bacterium]|nr:hypothetical protein [Rhodospirillales bacterium]